MPTVFLVLLAFLVSLGGCHKSTRSYEPSASYKVGSSAEEPWAGDEARDMAGAAAPMAPPAPMASASTSSRARKSPARTDGSSPNQAPATATGEAGPAARMVHYNGWMRLRAGRPDELLEQVSSHARSVGGEVESLTTTHVTVRVPVAVFESVFEALLAMGDVMDRSITAEDVTEAFAAADLRLQTARTTRDRLQELLARAKTEEEKLRLLQEIRRLTEEIDLAEAQVRVLANLAAFSRITVEVVPRQAIGQATVQEQVAGMEWISRLSPFRRDVAFAGRKLKLDVPEGFVVLNDRKHFVTESADGAAFWASRTLNEPRGTAAFWVDAVRQRLAPEFASAEISQVGDWQVLRLVDRSDDPYRYVIAIRIVGRWRQVVEIHYPHAAQEDRHGASVRACLEEDRG